MKKIWMCPKCGTASRRNANIRRHGLSVHGESLIPLGYDPLLQKFTLNEQVVHHTQQDLMPYFFPFKDKNSFSKMRVNDETNSLKYLTYVYNEIADLADAYERAKRHNLVGVVPSFTGLSGSTLTLNSFPYSTTQPSSLIDNSVMDQTLVTGFTGYLCPRYKTAISMSWSSRSLLTAKAKHELSCEQKLAVSKAPDSQEMQLLSNRLTKTIIFYTENLFTQPRYIECLEFNAFMEMPFVDVLCYKVDLGTVPNGHWAERACNNKKTEINDIEMKEFITKARASLAIFKVTLNTKTGYYFMMIGH